MSTPVAFIDKFIAQLKAAGVKGYTIDACKYEAISQSHYDPWSAPAPAPAAAGSTSNGDSAKRARFEDGSAPSRPPAGQLSGDAAVDKVKEMIASGKWTAVTADSKRANTGQYIEKYGEFSVKIMSFIIDGSERSTYDWKDTIKAAGYFHYSGSDKAGWTPFQLPGGKKGQGKEVKDQAELERYWEVKEFNTAKLNEAGDKWIWRGTEYLVSGGASSWGPTGPQGPQWGSNWQGD